MECTFWKVYWTCVWRGSSMWIESGGRAKVVKLGNVPHGSHRIGNDPMKLKPPVSGLSSHFILINQFSKQNSRSPVIVQLLEMGGLQTLDFVFRSHSSPSSSVISLNSLKIMTKSSQNSFSFQQIDIDINRWIWSWDLRLNRLVALSLGSSCEMRSDWQLRTAL